LHDALREHETEPKVYHDAHQDLDSTRWRQRDDIPIGIFNIRKCSAELVLATANKFPSRGRGLGLSDYGIKGGSILQPKPKVGDATIHPRERTSVGSSLSVTAVPTRPNISSEIIAINCTRTNLLGTTIERADVGLENEPWDLDRSVKIRARVPTTLH